MLVRAYLLIGTLVKYLEQNLNQNWTIFICENQVENVVCKMVIFLSSSQCVYYYYFQTDGHRFFVRYLGIYRVLISWSVYASHTFWMNRVSISIMRVAWCSLRDILMGEYLPWLRLGTRTAPLQPLAGNITPSNSHKNKNAHIHTHICLHKWYKILSIGCTTDKTCLIGHCDYDYLFAYYGDYAGWVRSLITLETANRQVKRELSRQGMV